MKLILSRKGVDSSAGGFASPIFPDGSMLSIPIPDKRATLRYRQINCAAVDVADPKRTIGRLVKDLSGGKVIGTHRVHLDPDLEERALVRSIGWQPLFGQCGAAQSHLHSCGVGAGDLFLFFGWFRQVEYHARRWRFVPGAPDQHVIYAWMQIESVNSVDELKKDRQLSWAHYHPHAIAAFSGSNVIYKATKHLTLPAMTGRTKIKQAGAGVFGHYHNTRCLTDEGCSRSRWRLPLWMHPQGRDSTLSYHSDMRRWQRDGECTLLRSVARGQEFVLDLDHYPEGFNWVRNLLLARVSG